MNKKEIKKACRDEIKKLRSDYREEKLCIKEKRKRALLDLRRQSSHPNDPPRRPVIDEIGNAVTHGVGAALAVFGFILILIKANSPVDYVSSSIYFAGLFIMFLSSCLYHSFRHGRAVKRLFHRFDYCSIYLLIGATFAPVLLSYIGGAFGFIFFGIQWAIIITAVVLISVFGPKRLKKLNLPMYLILGWSALLLLPELFSGGTALPYWILGGGVAYSLGVIPFALKKGPAHFIWHFFVLAGAVVQWFGIYFYVF